MQISIKTDFHTHSILSHDGGLTTEDYQQLIDASILQCVAVTDHNEIDFALELHQQLGQHCIVGEEVSTLDGHLIGLFLHKKIAKGKSAIETAQLIKEQGGFVYLPHPFETWRSGISLSVLPQILPLLDGIEVYNARSLQHTQQQLLTSIAHDHHLACAASSDAHGAGGVGSAYTILGAYPTRQSLSKLLQTAEIICHPAPVLSRLDPFLNRAKKIV